MQSNQKNPPASSAARPSRSSSAPDPEWKKREIDATKLKCSILFGFCRRVKTISDWLIDQLDTFTFANSTLRCFWRSRAGAKRRKCALSDPDDNDGNQFSKFTRRQRRRCFVNVVVPISQRNVTRRSLAISHFPTVEMGYRSVDYVERIASGITPWMNENWTWSRLTTWGHRVPFAHWHFNDEHTIPINFNNIQIWPQLIKNEAIRG